MPTYKGTDEILKIYQGHSIYRGDKVVQGSGLFISASGGSITYDGDYKIHSFATTGTSSLQVHSIGSPAADNYIEYLIQAGGGSGARTTNATLFASAGGAGGIQSGSEFATIGTFEVIVGAGGSNPGGTYYDGIDGQNSSLFSITACSGSKGRVDTGGGGNCDFSGSTAGTNNNGNGASNKANATDEGGNLSNTIQSGSFSSITGTSLEYGRGGLRNNTGFSAAIKGSGGNGGNGTNDSTEGANGIVIVRYKYQ